MDHLHAKRVLAASGLSIDGLLGGLRHQWAGDETSACGGGEAVGPFRFLLDCFSC